MKSTDSESSEKRDIFQYHFTSWPDHSVPRDTSAFLMFHHKLRSALAVDPGPIVAHCRYLFIYSKAKICLIPKAVISPIPESKLSEIGRSKETHPSPYLHNL